MGASTDVQLVRMLLAPGGQHLFALAAGSWVCPAPCRCQLVLRVTADCLVALQGALQQTLLLPLSVFTFHLSACLTSLSGLQVINA